MLCGNVFTPASRTLTITEYPASSPSEIYDVDAAFLDTMSSCALVRDYSSELLTPNTTVDVSAAAFWNDETRKTGAARSESNACCLNMPPHTIPLDGSSDSISASSTDVQNSVSADGLDWYDFPFDITSREPEIEARDLDFSIAALYSSSPTSLQGCDGQQYDTGDARISHMIEASSTIALLPIERVEIQHDQNLYQASLVWKYLDGKGSLTRIILCEC